MCTLLVAWHAVADVPLAVVANRDEARDRPFEAPQRRSWGRPVVAPKDCRAGGTWIGYNDGGVFAGLTNRWQQPEDPPATSRSRGRLVRTALGAETTAAAVTAVTDALAEAAYGPCHLFVADSTAARLIVNDGPGTQPRVQAIDPGNHVILNAGFDDQWLQPSTNAKHARAQRRMAARIQDHLEPATTLEEWRSRAVEVVTADRFSRCLCAGEFGTRSSSILCLGETPTWEFAPGPPCETAYEPVAAMPPR